jgi:hypothetical protein
MKVYMVYAWDHYYPTTANSQVQGLFFSEPDAIAKVAELKKDSAYDRVDYCEKEVEGTQERLDV